MIRQIALVAGASRGIGQDMAVALAAKRLSLLLAAEETKADLKEVASASRFAGAHPAAPSVMEDRIHGGLSDKAISARLETGWLITLRPNTMS